MLYNIKFKPHRRTSLWVERICDCVVDAKNKQSAKELGQAIVRDSYLDYNEEQKEYMTKQYSYIIEKECNQDALNH